MSVATTAAAAAPTTAAPAATVQTTEQTPAVTAVTEPTPASAELVVTLCAEAGMSDQIASLVKAKLTEAGVKSRIEMLGGVRDTLAAADLSAIFPEVSANIDDPAAMLKVALTAASAHGDDKEVTSSKPVQTQATSVKQPDHKSAYNDPSRL